MKTYFFYIVAFLVVIAFNPQKSNAQQKLQPDSTLAVMKKVADWQLRTWEKEGMRWPKWDWTNGAAYTGFMALNEIANDPKYSKAMYHIGEAINWNTGPRRTFGDDYCVAQMFSQMYSLYKEPKMIEHFRGLADTIVAMPHTEPLEWKNSIQLREWAWCDALFMAPPALAYFSTATGDKKYLDIASKLWWKTTDYLYDSTENLYFRDSKYFNQKEANGKKMFWARGNGWVIAGLVRMLENMPEDYAGRPRFIELFKKMAAKIASLQSPDGSWHAALLDQESYPAKETSGTAFFCYALAYGINHNLISYKTYNPVIEKAWAALVSSVHADGKLGNVQQIGEKPQSVDDNSTEVYGVGGFLLAGSQMIELLSKNYIKDPVLSLYNNTGVNRPETLVEIDYNNFVPKLKKQKSKSFKISNLLTGAEIPYQLEYKGGKNPVNILLLISLAPGSKIYATVTDEAPSKVNPKTYARFVPERYDDFAWENDRIAFRVYGAALEKRKDNAYGQDVWAKRTTRLVVDKWYKAGDYHVDHGEGMDYYSVGFTLGAGSNAPYVQDSIYFSKNFRKYKILDNGPLRSTFQLDFDDFNVDGEMVGASKTISLDAGSQLNKIEMVYSLKKKPNLPVAIGIVKRKESGTILLKEQQGIMGYWEPQHGKDGTLGIATIAEEPVSEMKVNSKHLLTIINSTSKKPFVYYSGAAWNKAGIITSSKEWFQYLENFKTQLQNPVITNWIK